MTRFTVGLFCVACLTSGTTAQAQTFEPRQISKNESGFSIFRSLVAPLPQDAQPANPKALDLLSQAGLEFNAFADQANPTLKLDVVKLRLHDWPSVKLFFLTGVPAVSETIPQGQTATSALSGGLQKALSDAAGGLGNFGVERAIVTKHWNVDMHSGGKVIEVPDSASDSTGSAHTIRIVGAASAKVEWTEGVDFDVDGTPAGVIFANVTAVYDYASNDVATRFDTSLKNHNIIVNGAAGINLPKAHFYVAALFGLYANDGRLKTHFGISLTPVR